jgi:hypothetical protein
VKGKNREQNIKGGDQGLCSREYENKRAVYRDLTAGEVRERTQIWKER